MNTTTFSTDTTTGEAEGTLCQRFDVVGMTCRHCEVAVTAEMSRLPGVLAVTVDVGAGTVTVDCTRELGHAEVAAAIDEAGYELAR